MGKFNNLLRDLADEEEKLTSGAATAVKNNAESLRNVVLTTSALAIALLAMMGWMISRSILNVLGGDPTEVKQIVEKVAQGDFTDRKSVV